jgi:hypothetical protein
MAMPTAPAIHEPARMFSRLTILLLAAVPAFCAADSKIAAKEKPVVAQTLADFDVQAAAVREGMQPGGIYSYINDGDKQRVEQRLDEMHQLLQQHSTQADLSQADRVALFNSQENLNALLLQNDNNRLECESGAHTGSRIHVTTCKTHGELMQRQRQDQSALSDLQRQSQTQLPSKDH